MGRPVKHYGKWRIRWVDEYGRRKSLCFDSFKDAEFVLRQRELDIEKIKRGLVLTEPTRTANRVREPHVLDYPKGKSFAELCEYWLQNRASQKRSGREDKSIIGHHLKPAFGNLMLGEIGAEQIDGFRLKLRHLDKQSVNNILKILIAMFNAAVGMRWIDEKPTIKKAKVSKYSTDYRFFRTKEEVSAFLAAAREHSEYAFVLYATAVYTGMRLGELAGLRKSNVDFGKRFIMVQSSFDGPTKNEGIRFVPILDPLLPILQRWFLMTPNDLVFPNEVGKMHQPSARIFQETLHKVLTAAKFPKVQIRDKERWYIRFHDLRHTFASHWMMNGGDIFRLQKILGHGSSEMTQRYAHLAPEVFASDYARLGKTDCIATNPSGTILPMKPSV